MADFIIHSLRGGQNEDTPIAIADDQCTAATNVEFVRSRLGERRLGATAINLTGSGLTGCTRITFLHRHLPTTDTRDAQLWALGITDPSTATLAYKTTTWQTVTPVDAIDTSYQYEVSARSLHGKLFFAYRATSGVDRLHVWDGTTLRRTGLAEPAAPSVTNTGSGSYSGTRYFRVRYAVMSGSKVLRRSEPSDTTTFSPSGSGSGALITKPASISESESHWEVEASLDNANFYRIARVAVGTTTYTDTTALSTGYANAPGAVLSETVGNYENIWAARYLTIDQDRLLFGGSFANTELASTVGWTPVLNDPGDGNDERVPVETNNTLGLDGFEGGPITGLSAAINGYVFAFKMSHVYQLVRSGVRTAAYEAIPLTKQRGALPGSVVEALDATGNPTLFALDPDIGPYRFGPRGVEPCGADLIKTWESLNLDATKVICRGLYFPEKKQVHWWIATGNADVPNLRIVLHTHEMREADDGMRRGWVVWNGPSASALAVCLFSDNIDANEFRSGVLKPFIGIEGNGLIWRTDVGDKDNGTDYFARIVTKPAVHGNLLHQFECKAGALMAKATANAVINVTVLANAGLVQKEVTNISLAPTASEEFVIKRLDNLSLAELTTLQIEFEDPATPGTQWSLDQFGLVESKGQRA